ncbi:MAG: adenylate/guanylate cyclase domain-containing protein, partial [Ilumatobacter sp.]|nr:adenylate/guanylate cyclase domain-containing protein [Ilumatobacter sp.]
MTVLFADIVGFTGLSEYKDPEQVKNFVDRCFALLADDITAFGGRVDKVVGDAIVALFGAPIAHEDDAERAVRAALRMQETVTRFDDETGVGIRLRIGINTGEVLVGAMQAGDDYTAMGDVVNTASRLQTTAEPGTVVVGADTHTATQELIRYRSVGQLHARGREA